MWKNIVERGRPQMTVWRKRIACWITKATDTDTHTHTHTHTHHAHTHTHHTHTHTQYVILIAFPQQQWLHERTSTLRHTYNARLVFIENMRNQKCIVCAECRFLTWWSTVYGCVLFTNIRR